MMQSEEEQINTNLGGTESGGNFTEIDLKFTKQSIVSQLTKRQFRK